MTAAPLAAGQGQLPGLLGLGLARTGIELRQFFRNREAVLFTFSLPTILLLLLGSLFSEQYEVLGVGVGASQVFAAGMLASGIMSTSFVSLGIEIATDRDNGALKRLRGTPMPAATYFVGKIGLVLVTSFAQAVLMLTVSVVLFDLGLPDSTRDWATLIWVFLLGVTACTLLGIAVSSLARTARSAPGIVQLPYLVLQFISGVFFTPVTAMPISLITIGSIFPAKWMAQGFRSALLPDQMKAFEMAGSWELGKVALIIGIWCVAGLVLCLTTFRWNRGESG